MSKIKWTYELAMAAAKDEADRHMRCHERTVWNEEDYTVACQTFERLMPVTVLMPHAADSR